MDEVYDSTHDLALAKRTHSFLRMTKSGVIIAERINRDMDISNIFSFKDSSILYRRPSINDCFTLYTFKSFYRNTLKVKNRLEKVERPGIVISGFEGRLSAIATGSYYMGVAINSKGVARLIKGKSFGAGVVAGAGIGAFRGELYGTDNIDILIGESLNWGCNLKVIGGAGFEFNHIKQETDKLYEYEYFHGFNAGAGYGLHLGAYIEFGRTYNKNNY